jgi:hypothetical protein
MTPASLDLVMSYRLSWISWLDLVMSYAVVLEDLVAHGL